MPIFKRDRTFFILLVIIIIFDQSSPDDVSVDQNDRESLPSTNEGEADDSSSPAVTLYKCEAGWSSVEKTFFEIPSHLRLSTMSMSSSVHDDGATKFKKEVMYNFTLASQNSQKCPNGSVTLGLSLLVDDDGENKLRLKPPSKIIPQMTKDQLRNDRNVYFTPKGFLKNNQDYFHPKSFCIDRLTDDEIQVKTCSPECIKDRPCIPKCCPMGMKIRMDVSEIFECGPPPPSNKLEEWEPIFESGGDTAENFQPHYFHNQLSCVTAPNGCVAIVQPSVFFSGQVAFTNWPATIQIQSTGQVTIQFPGHDPKLIDLAKMGEPPKYCVDGLIDMRPTEDGTEPSGLDREEDIVLIFRRSNHNSVASTLTNVMSLFGGAILLFILVIGFGLIWDKQDVHGWTMATFCFCHFGFFLCMAMGYGATLWFSTSALRTIPCILNGIFMQLMFIATFTWMTLLNFDLWSSIRPVMTSPKRFLSGNRRFLCYAAFGFGLPLLVVTISVILETQFGIRNTSIVRPQYGQFNCFLGPFGLIAHVILPIIILFIINIILTILIVVKFWLMWRATKRSGSIDSSAAIKSAKIRIKLMGQILIVLLISTGFTIGGWFGYGGNGPWTKWIGWTGSFYNVLQAFLLLWIIFWRKQTIRIQLTQKYECFAPIFERLQTFQITCSNNPSASKERQLEDDDDPGHPTQKMTISMSLTNSSSALSN